MLVCTVIAVNLTGCADDPSEPQIDNDYDFGKDRWNLTSTQEDLLFTNRNFGLDFFATFNEHCNKDNYIVSPFSLAVNLTMLANGAGGQTKAQILSALGVEPSQLTEANDLMRQFVENLPKKSKNCDVKVANSIWTATGVDLKPEFSQLMTKFFAAETFKASQAEMAANVNKWVAAKTDNKLTKLLEDGTPLDWFVANALYFNGKWRTPFKKDLSLSFKNADGTKSQVLAMQGTSMAYIRDGNGYTMTTVDYGGCSQFNMVLIVPDDGIDVDQAINNYVADEYGEIRYLDAIKNVDLTMPQFEVDYLDSLIPTVQAMGITDLFGKNTCDLSKMTNSPLFATVMQQGAKFKVDKTGTVIVVSTGTGGNVGSPEPIKTGKLVVDRPFAFLIRSSGPYMILFAGKVTKL